MGYTHAKRLMGLRLAFGRKAARLSWARPAWFGLALLLAAIALQGCRRDDQGALAQQSPIDIAGEFGEGAPSVEFAYGGGADRIVNSGKFIRAEYSDGGVIRIDGKEYALAEAHTHNPSEHTIRGESFALEMHLVHKSAAGDIAVVGVLYRAGAHNPRIQGLIDGAPAEADEFAEPPSRMEATGWLPSGGGGYYAYDGSLTTPPYTEGVQWIVMADALEISEAQVGELAALTGGGTNNRELQPINRRRIKYAANSPIVREGGCGCCACSNGLATGVMPHVAQGRLGG